MILRDKSFCWEDKVVDGLCFFFYEFALKLVRSLGFGLGMIE